MPVPLIPEEKMKNTQTNEHLYWVGIKTLNPVDIYLLKVNNRNNRTRSEICPKLTLTYFTHCSSVFIVNFEHVNAGWEL